MRTDKVEKLLRTLLKGIDGLTETEYTKLLDITGNNSDSFSDSFVGLSEREVKFWIDCCEQQGGDKK